MIRLVLTEVERDTIAEALDDPSINERAKRKLLALRMHLLNVPHGKIAQTLNISDDTVTNYLKLYQSEGIAGLLEKRYYQPTSQVEGYLDLIKDSLIKEPVATAKEVAAKIKQLCSVQLSESQARRIMKRLGLRHRKVAGVPGKATPNFNWIF